MLDSDFEKGLKRLEETPPEKLFDDLCQALRHAGTSITTSEGTLDVAALLPKDYVCFSIKLSNAADSFMEYYKQPDKPQHCDSYRILPDFFMVRDYEEAA